MKVRYRHDQAVVVFHDSVTKRLEIRHDYVDSAPMDDSARADNYLNQTGRPQLTPRQRRRMVHKSGRAITALTRGNSAVPG